MEMHPVPNAFANNSQAHTPPLPKRIGPYEIEAFLETGSTSWLYLAIHQTTREPIAIKVLFPELVSHPEMLERFLQEAAIIEMAQHPNIVKLYGHGQWQYGLYIAMEFVPGISLKKYLSSHLISLKQALKIVMEIAIALCHLHVHGVVHRDLKPENILITEDQRVKVIDFGIAQLLGKDPSHAGTKGRLIGTPVYMSPEQRMNPESVSYPSDIYSLGIIAYELILGKLSYGQVHLSLIPKELRKILVKCLQQSVEKRYQDIVDLIIDLSRYLQSDSVAKEQAEISPLAELSENLQRAQNSLTPAPPQWSDVALGFAHYKNSGASGLYYDFFTMPENTHGIIIAQPLAKSSGNILQSSALRGMSRALCHLSEHPHEIATVLNELLIADPFQPAFSFVYLLVDPRTRCVRFITSGAPHATLLVSERGTTSCHTADHAPLGASHATQFQEVEIPYTLGAALLLYAPFLDLQPHENKERYSCNTILSEWQQVLTSPPEHQAQFFLRKAQLYLSRTAQDRALVVAAIHF